MSKTKFISFFTLISILCYPVKSVAQNYHNLVDTTSIWNMTRSIYNAQTYTYTARIDKIDTLINGKIYQKIVSDTLHLLPEFESHGYLGFIREELSTKKVFYTNLDYGYDPFQFSQNEERLLYDFSLEIGDTTTVMTTMECNNSGTGYTSLKVNDIDSIQLIDGSERKRWYLEDIFSGDEVFWVEGIGSQFGLYITSCPYTSIDTYKYSLLCFYNNSNHLYQEQGKDTCGIFWTSGLTDIQVNNENIKIHPNPARTKIKVQLEVSLNNKSEIEYQIIDSYGKLQQKALLKDGGIDVSNLQSGMYFIGLKTGQIYLGTRKLIIQ